MTKMKSISLAVVVSSVLVGIPVTAMARAQPLYNPEPIQVPCSLNAPKILSVVRTSVLGRGWIPKEINGSTVEARLDKRSHVAVVDIKYDSKKVTIRYKSSVDLDYVDEGGTAKIHGNYNKWIKNIEKDIALNLSKACT